MKTICDLHCHTIASTHAYNTLFEMARQAVKNGMEMIAITDHGPDMKDAPHRWHFVNSRIWPHEIEGITVIPGVEANVMDYDGRLDLGNDVLDTLPWVIASCHSEILKPRNPQEQTHLWECVAKNPQVDLIGHCGQEIFSFDRERVIKCFKEYGKIVEINNNSALVRPDSRKNCVEIAKLCKRYQVPVCVNTDAHIAFQIGQVQQSLQMLEEIGFPEELIFNSESAKITEHIKAKKGVTYAPIK